MAQAPSERAACDLMRNIYRYLYGQDGDISCKDSRDRLFAYYGGKFECTMTEHAVRGSEECDGGRQYAGF